MFIIPHNAHLMSKVLRKRCDEVTVFDPNLKAIVSEMRQLMGEERGIGLAANQVGVSIRLFIMKFPGKGSKKAIKRGLRYTIINPEYRHKSDVMVVSREGCLSFPGIRRNVTRHESVTIAYQDVTGDPHELKAEGLLSRCIQHEIDHLNGITFIERSNQYARSAGIELTARHLKN